MVMTERETLKKIKELAEEASLTIDDVWHVDDGCRLSGTEEGVTCFACLAQDKLAEIRTLAKEALTFTLAATQLQQIMPNLPEAKRDAYLPFLAEAMEDHEINTPLRAAAFLAQIAHESAELRFMQELWGPTAQQKKYEPPSDLAKDLGNTAPGDGFRYRGRGPIQITGRANYKKYGELLGVDLVGNPDLAAQPEHAFQIAGLFWSLRGLNKPADAEDFTTITKRINGGLTGLAERERYYEVAKKALGIAA
jgi:putative chitinase